MLLLGKSPGFHRRIGGNIQRPAGGLAQGQGVVQQGKDSAVRRLDPLPAGMVDGIDKAVLPGGGQLAVQLRQPGGQLP